LLPSALSGVPFRGNTDGVMRWPLFMALSRGRLSRVASALTTNSCPCTTPAIVFVPKLPVYPPAENPAMAFVEATSAPNAAPPAAALAPNVAADTRAAAVAHALATVAAVAEDAAAVVAMEAVPIA